MNKTEIKTLCPKCRGDYENTGDYYIRRVDPKQKIKDKCDFCSVKLGYDYELTSKSGKEGRR